MKKILAILSFVGLSSTVFAGFASNEVYLASIGRGGGAGGAQFYSTLWVTNLSSSATVHFTFFFLKDGQSNLTGDPSFNDTLAPGQTKLYEDVTETKLSLPGLFGAARITADGEIFASERVYNLAHSTDNLGTSEGLFFAAVPKSFAIGLGETASIQGVNQGSSTENMRSNFDLVETTGNTCKVHVTLLDSNGTSKGATDVNMNPYGHVKLNAQALLSSVNTINGRIVATVTSGSGKVILAGEQLANTSQDSSGFEMSFKDSLISGNTGGNCSLCVTSLNGLSGAVTIAAGTNVTVGTSGQTITINAASGGGLVLPFAGNNPSPPTTAFSVSTSAGTAISAESESDNSPALSGENLGNTAGAIAVYGLASGGTGVVGIGFNRGVVGNTNSASGYNVTSSVGVWGDSQNSNGVIGTSSSSVGVFGHSDSSIAVQGISNSNAGVSGTSTSGSGILGTSSSGYGIYGTSTTGTAVRGTTGSASGLGGTAGVWGDANPLTGVYGTTVSGNGVLGRASAGGIGVYGQSASGYGIYGISGSSWAGFIQGDFNVTNDADVGGNFEVEGNSEFVGSVSKPGGSFKIDHPLDPANRYLYHSFVESPDMMNIYNGEVTLSASGVATITMPEWFQALNQEFRYQLTALDTPQPGLYIAKRVAGNQFTIAGGAPGASVSWQLTGIRHDAWANAHRIPVEKEKSGEDRGRYLHPELFGASPDQSIARIHAEHDQSKTAERQE